MISFNETDLETSVLELGAEYTFQVVVQFSVNNTEGANVCTDFDFTYASPYAGSLAVRSFTATPSLTCAVYRTGSASAISGAALIGLIVGIVALFILLLLLLIFVVARKRRHQKERQPVGKVPPTIPLEEGTSTDTESAYLAPVAGKRGEKDKKVAVYTELQANGSKSAIYEESQVDGAYLAPVAVGSEGVLYDLGSPEKNESTDDYDTPQGRKPKKSLAEPVYIQTGDYDPEYDAASPSTDTDNPTYSMATAITASNSKKSERPDATYALASSTDDPTYTVASSGLTPSQSQSGDSMPLAAAGKQPSETYALATPSEDDPTYTTASSGLTPSNSARNRPLVSGSKKKEKRGMPAADPEYAAYEFRPISLDSLHHRYEVASGEPQEDAYALADDADVCQPAH